MLGHSGDQPLDLDFIDRSDAHVVEKHQRIAASGQDVVDVHRHQILAGMLEKIVLEQQLDLCPDTVAAGHNHRLVVVAEIVTGREQTEGLHQLSSLLRCALGVRRYLRPAQLPP